MKTKKRNSMPSRTYAEFKSVAPYFDLARGALGDLVDGAHFFDVVDEKTVYEVLYQLGWPRVIRGRTALMAAFRGYADSIALHAADHLVTHLADDGRVVVIEYEVHGKILATGVDYDNRFCSVIRVANRKIAHWRDYMDSLAASNALNAPGR
jgi:ketosteroid isomerase-like protein